MTSGIKYIYCPQLAGQSIRLTDGTLVVFTDDDGGGAGVREPRRPKPTRPAASRALAHI